MTRPLFVGVKSKRLEGYLGRITKIEGEDIWVKRHMEGRGPGQKCHWEDVYGDTTFESTPLARLGRATTLKDLSRQSKERLKSAAAEEVVSEKRKYKREVDRCQ